MASTSPSYNGLGVRLLIPTVCSVAVASEPVAEISKTAEHGLLPAQEVLPSLEAKDVEGPIINALRKEVDRRQLEFVKSGKLVPVQFSSRHYDFKRSKWIFGRPSGQDVALLLCRKVYWQTKLVGGTVWVGDATEALYVESSVEHILAAARKLAEEGLMTLQGEYASANASLMAQSEKFEGDMKTALSELEKKHAFERG